MNVQHEDRERRVWSTQGILEKLEGMWNGYVPSLTFWVNITLTDVSIKIKRK